MNACSESRDCMSVYMGSVCVCARRGLKIGSAKKNEAK